MSQPSALMWFRQDLRLSDNTALLAALRDGPGGLICVYVLEADNRDARAPAHASMGGASRWWLHGSLEALSAALAARGNRLVIRQGDAREIVPALAVEAGCRSVHWSRRYEPDGMAIDQAVEARLAAAGIVVTAHAGALLVEPASVTGQSGSFYRVYSPFWRALQARLSGTSAPRAQAAPQAIPMPPRLPASATIDALQLRPTRPDWAAGLREAWTPGEAGATARLAAFLDTAAPAYADRRDFPGEVGTSRLSPHLHFGEISPVQVWQATADRAASEPHLERGAAKFLSELAWREFSQHLLVHVPSLPERPLRSDFEQFPWVEDPVLLKAWQRGRTGYPIVDAGMRELWVTGWMHNRVRMIVASFLVKHLLQPWQDGAAWFWDTLVDADLGNNSASWQWVAGCGADAAPYFRVFNPVLQGEKFDPDGAYVRRWLPEIASLPDRLLHRPWEATPLELAAAGIRPGVTYPQPIVDHGMARARALAAFEQIKKAA